MTTTELMMPPSTLTADLEHARGSGIFSAAQDAALDYDVPLSFLLAVGSRESRLGRILPPSCIGPGGEHGVWQINPRGVYGRWTAQNDPCDHGANAQKAASILSDELERFAGHYKRAAAAYNTGPADVRRLVRQGRDPDAATTGGGYGADVVRRMQFYQQALPVQMDELIVRADYVGFSQRAVSVGFLGVGVAGIYLLTQ